MNHKKHRRKADIDIERNLQLSCLERQGWTDPRRKGLSESFLRKPYSGTKAETKDNQQTKIHEFDWMNPFK